jgi:protein-disulfide isomerase
MHANTSRRAQRSGMLSVLVGSIFAVCAFSVTRWRIGEKVELVADWRSLASSDRAIDTASPPVSAVIFLDYLCVHCATLERILEDSLPGDLRDSVRVYIRHVPSSSRARQSMTAALLVNCSIREGRGKIAHQWLLRHQDMLVNSTIKGLIGEVGLADSPTVAACMSDSVQRATIARDVQLAQHFAITVTPTIAVDSVVIRGTVSARKLSKVIRASLDGRPRRAW